VVPIGGDGSTAGCVVVCVLQSVDIFILCVCVCVCVKSRHGMI
jgi:hypothetical protein